MIADHSRLREIKITDIKVGQRHRKDLGDLTTLAVSIRQEGLLQPIGVTNRLELVFGERRIRAVRDILKKKTILARIVDVSSILAGEYHENEIRKDFTPSERVEIAKAIERQIGNRRGQRVQNFAQVGPGQKTRDAAAEGAGFRNHETYRQAAKVVENGTARLIQAMDGGRVSISAAALLAEFVAWAGREWNLVQDAYWWSFDAMPLTGTSRKQGLLRQSVKMCIWLGAPHCSRNQDNVLWMPSDTIFAERKSEMALRTTPAGRTYRDGRIADTAEQRGGTSPFNLLPVPAGATSATSNGHPASLPYDVAAWWVKYLLPEKGVLLDCFCGSGTMLSAGLDFGASKVIGIEQHKRYIKIAEKRIGGG